MRRFKLTVLSFLAMFMMAPSAPVFEPNVGGIQYFPNDPGDEFCTSGKYYVFADASEEAFKKCEDGVLSVLGSGGPGGGSFTPDDDPTVDHSDFDSEVSNNSDVAANISAIDALELLRLTASGELDGEDCNGEVTIVQQNSICIDLDGAVSGDDERPVIYMPGGANGTTVWNRVTMNTDLISDHSLLPSGLIGDTGHDDKMTIVAGTTNIANVDCPDWADDTYDKYVYHETDTDRMWLCTTVGVSGVAVWSELHQKSVPFPMANSVYGAPGSGSANTVACFDFDSGAYRTASANSCATQRDEWRAPEDIRVVGLEIVLSEPFVFLSLSGGEEDERSCELAIRVQGTRQASSAMILGDTTQGADFGKSAAGTTPTDYAHRSSFSVEVDEGERVGIAFYQPPGDTCTDGASCACWDADSGSGNMYLRGVIWYVSEIRP